MQFSKKIKIMLGLLSIAIIWVGFCNLRQNNNHDLIDSLATAADVEDEIDEVTGSEAVIDENLSPQVRPEEFDQAAKRKQVVQLVEDALDFVNKHTFDVALNSFTHGKDFIRGELYLFVYDLNGVTLANGQDARLVWRDQSQLRDGFGTFIIQEMLKKAKEGGGWITYQWRNSTKVSYIKSFKKDGKEYIIGSGYYPHSKSDLVVSLVKGAVAYFNDVVINHGLLVDEVFSTLSYPAGRFVAGDLYLYAVSFDGVMMANGDRPGLIGTNVLNVKDTQGNFPNKEIINKLKNSSDGVWVEYISKNATKRTYAEKLTDNKGKDYFVACGYYPDETPQKAVDLVKNGYEFMKKQGLSAAIAEFSDRRVDTYRFGDLYLVVYDLKGIVVAHGGNSDNIGINFIDVKDEDGKYYVREILEKANRGGGWVDFKLKNAFQSAYVEKVDLGTDSYVITSGLYPVSKRETALLLARSAAGYLRTHTEEEAFGQFSDPAGKFIRGDLYVFAIEFDGISNVWGDNSEMIWRNIFNATDDNGKPYVQIFINTVKQGPGQVTYHINGHPRIALIEAVEKGTQKYVIGTGYYL